MLTPRGNISIFKTKPANLMQILDGILEKGHEFGQAEMSDFVHLGVDENLERADCEGNVGSRRRRRQRVMKRLPPKIRSVDRLHQIAA